MTLIALIQDNPALFYGIVALTSLFVGSFLNVVIHRLPIMMEREWAADLEAMAADAAESEGDPRSLSAAGASGTSVDMETEEDPERFNLAVPRSHCPSCDAPITALQNVPIISWLLLRGKCANCRAPISIRYPLVEATTMIMSLVVAVVFGPTPEALLGIVVTWFLIAMSMIDFDTQLLPDNMTLPLMWLGLIASLVPVFVGVREAVIGAAAGYLILWSIFWLFKLIAGKEGMGYGDFKLLAALGALLGWQALPSIILLSSVVGAVVGITIIVVTRRSKDIPIPFGPYLAAAGWIAMLWGEELGHWYRGVML